MMNYEVTIYLRSGASFTVVVTDMTIRRTEMRNELVGIDWKSCQGLPSFRYLRLEDVSAIVSRLVPVTDEPVSNQEVSDAVPV